MPATQGPLHAGTRMRNWSLFAEATIRFAPNMPQLGFAATQGHLHAGTCMWDWLLAEACIMFAPSMPQLLGFASNAGPPRAREVTHFCGSSPLC